MLAPACRLERIFQNMHKNKVNQLIVMCHTVKILPERSATITKDKPLPLPPSSFPKCVSNKIGSM